MTGPTSDVSLTIGDVRFGASLMIDEAPKTCAFLLGLLPFRHRLIHARWSGEACWVPLGDAQFGVPNENATRHPAPGTMLLFGGGISESELLLAYGAVSFASKAGLLAGNPVLKISENLDTLAKLGREILWNGSQELVIERM